MLKYPLPSALSAFLPIFLSPVNLALSSPPRALRNLSNQWWTRMLWRQERGKIQHPLQGDGGQRRLLSQDVAPSFSGTQAGPQQTQAVCPRADTPSHSSHGLGGAERHGPGLRGRPRTWRALGQQGVGTLDPGACPPPWPPASRPGCSNPRITSCRAWRAKLEKRGLNPNKDTHTQLFTD